MAGMRAGTLPGVAQAADKQRAQAAAKEAKPYDFRRPEKFSRDQLRTLRGIHDQLTRLLNSSLAAHLRTTVDFQLEDVAALSYQDFTAHTQEGALIYVIALEPLPAPILLEVSNALVFTSVDRVLGGTGKKLAREREPTEIERSLFQESLLVPVLENVCAAWQSIEALTPTITAVETNAGYVQIGLPTDVVVEVKLGATIGDGMGSVRLGYTYAALEPILPRLDTQRLVGSGSHRRQANDSANVQRALKSVSVPVVARLGLAEVTTEELLGLQRGDVVRLDTLIEREIDVLVNGELKYRGRPGLRKHRLAVRITTVVAADGDEDEDEGVAGGAG